MPSIPWRVTTQLCKRNQTGVWREGTNQLIYACIARSARATITQIAWWKTPGPKNLNRENLVIHNNRPIELLHANDKLTLCITRDNNDWQPIGSSMYEQAPTFCLMYKTPELNGLFLSPTFHQGLSIGNVKHLDLKENQNITFIH